MHTERLFLDTDSKGNLKGLPKFPPNKKIEAVFMVHDTCNEKTAPRRTPHRDITGKVRIMGNIYDSASENEWNLPE
jgi:hypothetical protein